MSDENGEKKKIELTIRIEDLLSDGITINTGEQIILTVVDADESVSG